MQSQITSKIPFEVITINKIIKQGQKDEQYVKQAEVKQA